MVKVPPGVVAWKVTVLSAEAGKFAAEGGTAV
jgi:hypothetical protein